VDDILHVILVVSNPCLYKRRYQLARECIDRLHRTRYIAVYLVELAYGDQPFVLTDSTNPRHLQLRTEHPLWHKENMINLGVRRLLPTNWKAMAWVDADLEFLNPYWGRNALEELKRNNVIQLFDRVTLLGPNNERKKTRPSLFYTMLRQNSYNGHCGFAWAIRRDLYERMGGFYDRAILGSGDSIIAYAFEGRDGNKFFKDVSPGFFSSIQSFQSRAINIRIGYIQGEILHYFHGSFKNRKYSERWDILRRYQYDPTAHVTYKDGLLVPTSECPPQLLADILTYFQERNEDDPIDDDLVVPQSSGGASTEATL
jgi:hypothetical protein